MFPVDSISHKLTAMKTLALILVSLAVVVNCDEEKLQTAFVEGNRLFSADVYNELKATNTGNFVFCPLSAEIILALTRIGAKGNTGTQLSQALHIPDDTTKIQKIFQNLTPKLISNDDYTLNSANRIYLNTGYQIRDDFRSIARESFSADVKTVNFKAKDDAVREINQWVSERTFDKIQNLLDPKLLSEDTRTVLVNALYFKSTWKTKFDKTLTRTKPFYLNNNDHVDVDMMENTASYLYANSIDLKAQILEMPYVGGEYSMVIVLPHDKEGLAELEGKMENVLNTSARFKAKVHVEIPKFKIQTDIKLTDILKNLGVKDAFENYADLSGFSAPGEQPLKISDVVQKAVIEVDEKGTVAAAATAVIGTLTYSAMRPIIHQFKADHPFIYYINGPNGVMFIGRYVK
ncbi:hypothetical protein FQR65_LT03546 [Abscondita terminalis]|nr:hypothetical protein FQR65_LT03546 [Abscondita terminalis]